MLLEYRHAETGDLSMYNDDSASQVDMEAVADGPATSLAQVQAYLKHAAVIQLGSGECSHLYSCHM